MDPNGIKKYLADTEADDRVWKCYQILSSQRYMIAIHIETPYIDYDSADLTD